MLFNTKHTNGLMCNHISNFVFICRWDAVHRICPLVQRKH